MIAHTCNPRTYEDEFRESLRVWGEPGISSEFQVNLSYSETVLNPNSHPFSTHLIISHYNSWYEVVISKYVNTAFLSWTLFQWNPMTCFLLHLAFLSLRILALIISTSWPMVPASNLHHAAHHSSVWPPERTRVHAAQTRKPTFLMLSQ